VPMIGCKCEVCTSSDPRDKRSRTSIVVEYDNRAILIDVTPELRLQAIANDLMRIDSVVITHAHADHIMGMDDLRRFNVLKDGPLDLWMDERTSKPVRNCFGYCFSPTQEEGVFRPLLVEQRINGPFDLYGRTWTPIPMIHGRGHVLGFRIDDFAYCTDVSSMPEESFALIQGLDLLILDALQETKHPTHFNIAEALDVVDRVEPKRTFFTHMSHRVKHERDEPKLPPNVKFLYDGLRLTSSRN
ncbi:MAG TPA: MBL fold metallo-hydrolase, partial [Tepidisphaeraceae bacterium]|nr:MBL fold metallo-hydrolase [Tepidisphaeraceae bacterium]